MQNLFRQEKCSIHLTTCKGFPCWIASSAFNPSYFPAVLILHHSRSYTGKYGKIGATLGPNGQFTYLGLVHAQVLRVLQLGAGIVAKIYYDIEFECIFSRY